MVHSSALALLTSLHSTPTITAHHNHASPRFRCVPKVLQEALTNAGVVPQLRSNELSTRRSRRLPLQQLTNLFLLYALCHQGADEVDWLLLHQANIRIMETVAKKLGIPMEKVTRCSRARPHHHANRATADRLDQCTTSVGCEGCTKLRCSGRTPCRQRNLLGD